MVIIESKIAAGGVVKGNGWIGWALVLCLWLEGCTTVTVVNEVVEAAYISDAGTILPELQWHEEFRISREQVTLIRRGRTKDSQVNEGLWEISIEEGLAEALFESLSELDCSKMQRIEPEDAPDGGETSRYTLIYADGKRCSLVFDPGVSYRGGEGLVELVTGFVSGLNLPAEGASRYRLEQPGD